MSTLLSLPSEVSLSQTAVAVVAGTCALWFLQQHRDGSTPAPSPASHCEKRCTLATYEHASITQQELSKLYASPKYLIWLRNNEARIHERNDAQNRVQLWRALCVFMVAVLAIIGLPFNTFSLEGSDVVTLNDILRTVQPLSKRFVGCLALMSLSFSFFAPGAKEFRTLGAVAGLVILLWAADAIALGAGFLALVASVSVQVFWL